MKAAPVKFEHYDLNEQGGGHYVDCPISEATHVELWLPGPLKTRYIPFILRGNRDTAGRLVWTWNGDTEKPTIKPSILTLGFPEGKEIACHTWVNDGKAQFLTDCTHELAGQILDLLEIIRPQPRIKP